MHLSQTNFIQQRQIMIAYPSILLYVKKFLRWWREFYVREAPCGSLQYDRLTARHRLHQPGQSQYRMWGVPTRWKQWSVPTPRAEAPHPTTGGRELSVANQSGPISGEPRIGSVYRRSSNFRCDLFCPIFPIVS